MKTRGTTKIDASNVPEAKQNTATSEEAKAQ